MQPSRRILIGMSMLAFPLVGIVSRAQTPRKDQKAQASPSTSSNPKTNVTTRKSMVVEADSTPEEIEDGRIGHLFQPIYKIQQQHECQNAIEKYRSVVIPAAEQSTFRVPKNKFLFLASRGIGDCDMELGNFVEAEEMYQKAFGYMSVWPGTDNSSYPIIFESLGAARMRQQR